ncbi:MULTISPECIES: cation diffusion facilitator family transporter [unclassified Fusibacter]|uniref:cation diffusion facilitator family transporter n=1 Tax=unclassified Fusibacter TaxID=2624464 RepID=UPI0013E9266C|nr:MULTISPECIES: cation diffusion facilitator family transporter [unclassified Fusibacter]MCK8060960.1 cation diffusion facilitator family transporter [Fusibacter sp. A2]NPE23256.1 cation transporter [Fusibacter sp. A1]
MDHHDHHHHGTNRIGITIALNLIITVAQVVGGLVSGSLSLLSDAAHNFSDVIALVVSYIGGVISVKPSTDAKTFGYKRAEIIAALTNVVSVMFIGVTILVEAVKRVGDPVKVNSSVVIWLAALSIVMNGLSVLIIQKPSKNNLNIRSAYLHLFTDMLTSVAVMASGIAMALWQWYWLDTVLSVAISVYLIATSFKLLSATLSILMLFAPSQYDPDKLMKLIGAVDEVLDVHHVHAWQLTDTQFHFEGHVVIREDLCLSETVELRKRIKDLIRKQGFSHVTLELEYERCVDGDCTKEND